MLTAAVRDLHRAYPESFLTDVRTRHPALWTNNPFVTPISESEAGVEIVECQYPLVQDSNQLPYHFIHGFIFWLNEQLGLNIKPTDFKGDLHLSSNEVQEAVPFGDLIESGLPIWLITTGGKRNFTIKWWDVKRHQQVVDHFRDKIQFVQIGAPGDFHPELNGVLDLRGKTDLRTLIKLVYHSDGVISPVSLPMHLAAAVPTKPDQGLRPCVVIAGGGEPPHWEAYPGHQFLHTIGMLACCRTGGCWRTRAVPLPDNSPLNRSDRLCVDTVGKLPRCMDMIQASEVITQVERYLLRHSRDQELRKREATRFILDDSARDCIEICGSDVITRAAFHASQNGASDTDRILTFYRKVNATPKEHCANLRDKVLTNTPQGIGDTLLLTALLRAAANQNTVRYIDSQSAWFQTLMEFNPYYARPVGDDKVAADVLQRRYAMGNGHFMQRLQRGFGLEPELRPRGVLDVSGTKRSNRVALHFEAGDTHAAWQRIFVHPRARQLYPESRAALQAFINSHSEFTFVQIGRKPTVLDNVEDCTGLPLSDSIQVLGQCEYFIGIVSGPMHLATALGLKCVVILNFPRAEEIYLPTLKDINLVESEWLYPQNVHLHQESEGPLVKRFSLSNLERAMAGQVYPYWSDEFLGLIHEKV